METIHVETEVQRRRRFSVEQKIRSVQETNQAFQFRILPKSMVFLLVCYFFGEIVWLKVEKSDCGR